MTWIFEKFFNPSKVALVGASERGLYPSGIIKNLLENGFSGKIFPVNPNRTQVFGLRSFPSLRQLPEPADLAVITIPRDAVVSALEDCIAIGIPAALIITAGFSELDEKGMELESQIKELITSGNIRIIGPNCAGLANISKRVILARLPGIPSSGTISLISQSGALMMALYGELCDIGAGMSKLVSVGNQVDLTLADVAEYLVEDLDTNIIGIFMEDIRKGDKWIWTASNALRKGKPIIVLKSGRTVEGQKAAASHTAAVAGSDKVFQAFCRQFGITLVGDVKEFIYTIQLFEHFISKFKDFNPLYPKIAVITQSGGLGSLTADLLAMSGVLMHSFSSKLQEELKKLGHIVSSKKVENPIDVRGEALIGSVTYETLQPFFEDEETEGILLLLAKPLYRPEDIETARALIRLKENYSKPLFVVWVGPRNFSEVPENSEKMLLKAGIPVYSQVSDFVRALSHVHRYYGYRKVWLSDPENIYARE